MKNPTYKGTPTAKLTSRTLANSKQITNTPVISFLLSWQQEVLTSAIGLLETTNWAMEKEQQV